MDRYKHIKTKENYSKLLKSGMLWEFYPELTGQFEVDKKVIIGIVSGCTGCKWLHSDSRNAPCPICNSNYDMYEKL